MFRYRPDTTTAYSPETRACAGVRERQTGLSPGALRGSRPPSMNTTRLATSRAKAISCVTTSMVMCSSASSRMVRNTSPVSSGSSAEVGSSKSMMSGSMASARAMATRCFCPPESRAGIGCRVCPTRPTLREQAPPPWGRISSRRKPLTVSGASMMFCKHGQVRKQVEVLEDHAHGCRRCRRISASGT